MNETMTRPDLHPLARQLAAAARRDWYRIENAQSDEATVVIDGVIDSWWGDVSSTQIAADLRRITAPTINVLIDSPGGSVFEGWQIYNALKAHPARINVEIGSLAASIASVIAMAGDQIIAAKPSDLMIHDAWGVTIGPARDHAKNAEVLGKLSAQIAGVYADRAGGTAAEWRARMLEETWYTESEALAAGLVTGLSSSAQASARNQSGFDLSIFVHPPAALLAAAHGTSREPTKRAVEQALRDAGLSVAEAKAMIAKGWPDDEPEREAALQRLYTSLAGLR